MQDNNGAPLGIESPQCMIEDLSIGKGGGDVPDRRITDGCEFHFDDPTAATAREVDAGMDDKLAKPGVEAIEIAQ